MSRAPRQAQPTPAEPGTEPRAVAEGYGHQLAVEDARRIATALEAAGQPVPPDILARLEEDVAPTAAPQDVAPQASEA